MTSDERVITLLRAGLNTEVIAAILDADIGDVEGVVGDPAHRDVPAAPGGSAWQVVKAIALVNHGQPTVTELLTPTITVVVTDVAVVEVVGYLEVEENGGFWTIGLVDNGVAVLGNDGAPLAGSASLVGWAGWGLTGVGAQFGAPLAGLGLGLAQAGGTESNLVVLPAGTHELALGVPASLNGGVAGSLGAPDVNVRNAVLGISVIA